MILERKNNYMFSNTLRRNAALFFFILLALSCNTKTKLTELKQSYWLYSPIIQVVNKDTESEKFEFSGKELTKKEARALIIVLQQRGYLYKVTIDSQIMVSKLSVPDINALSFVDAEMRQLINDSSKIWRWGK